jgi:hypothetical protein
MPKGSNDMNVPALLTVSAAVACMTIQGSTQASTEDLQSSRRSYHTVDIDGLKIF